MFFISFRQNWIIPLALLGMGFVIAVGLGLAVGLRPVTTTLNHVWHFPCEPKHETTGFKSAYGKYRMSAVQSDNDACSKIGM